MCRIKSMNGRKGDGRGGRKEEGRESEATLSIKGGNGY